MRVISGIAKRHILETPKGINTRPTTDRVKESVFNMIMEYVMDADVLDLFAGSGGLGIEALSRGAKSCIFIDNDRNSLFAINENLKNTKLFEKAKIYKKDSFDVLEFFDKREIKFDLVILDPPYNQKILSKVLKIINSIDIVKRDGIVVAEMNKKEDIIREYTHLKLINEKTYGETCILIFKKV